MTWLQGLLVKVLMLAVTVGVLYWAVAPEDATEPEQPAAGFHRADDSRGDGEPAEATDGQRTVRAADNGGAAQGALDPQRTGSGRSAKAAAAPRRAVTFPLDLNTAKAEELMELPGIGEKLAQRLVEYRQSHGGFRNVEDLRNVRGIGEKRMERLRPLVVTAAAP